MDIPKFRPSSVGTILQEEFLLPLSIDHSTLANAMGVHRNTISRIVNDKGRLTSEMAVKLAATLGTTPMFWLNLQHMCEMWEAMNAPTDPETLGVRQLNTTISSS